MVSKKIFRILLSICLISTIFSCDTDKIGPDDFSTPELTAENTIQFTIKSDKHFQMEIVASGGRTAVDWGDGHINKYSAKRMESSLCNHTYQKAGTYQVKVLCDETVIFNISGLIQPISELKLGNCPKLETLYLNTISDIQSFAVDNCPKLENLNIGNWPDLTFLDLSTCTEIKSLDCYTHPNLRSLNLDNNKKLTNLNLSYTGITELDLENMQSLTKLNCDHNQLTNLTLKGNYRLREVACSNNKLSTINISKGTNLQFLTIRKNELTTIDLSKQTYLRELNCTGNQLTDLDVSENTELAVLFCGQNKLEMAALNKIFKDLPLSKDKKNSKTMSPNPLPSIIQIKENPGAASCDLMIIKDKGWVLTEENDKNAL